MEFLDRADAALVEKKLARELAQHGKPKVIVYYDSAPRDYAPAANPIARAAGEFEQVTLLFQWAIGGDGWNETSLSDERWQRYRAWRETQREGRRLYDTPLHLFGPGDRQLLSQVIVSALELGWDALLAAKPGRQLVFLSHDDRLEIYRGFGARELARELVKLGYWHLPRI